MLLSVGGARLATTTFARRINIASLSAAPSVWSTSSAGVVAAKTGTRTMATIVKGVEFDTIAREMRCKWSADNDKKSLEEAQIALNEILDELKAVDGVKKVDRVVCGGCLDFKVITSLPAGPKWEAWEQNKFAPEETFLKKLESIDGITTIETQTYTIMPM